MFDTLNRAADFCQFHFTTSQLCITTMPQYESHFVHKPMTLQRVSLWALPVKLRAISKECCTACPAHIPKHTSPSSHSQAHIPKLTGRLRLVQPLGMPSPVACIEALASCLQDVMGMVRNLYLVLTNEQVRCQLQINARQTAEQFTPVAISER